MDEVQKLKKQIGKNIKVLEERKKDFLDNNNELTNIESNIQIQKDRLTEINKYKKT